MSGDEPTAILGGRGGASMCPLISALAEVIGNLEPPCALIGGLAVAARLSRVERVTGDVGSFSAMSGRRRSAGWAAPSAADDEPPDDIT